MPYTLPQLEAQYKAACDKIIDCKEYTLQNLGGDFFLKVEDFYTDLEKANLRTTEAGFVKMEEIIQQCRLAMKTEKSRRSFQEKLEDKATEYKNRTMNRLHFKEKKSLKRLEKASPYSSKQKQSKIEHMQE